jgi:hypothetical protein
MSTAEIILSAISLVVGVVGGIVGAYVGMKVGITKLELLTSIMQDGLSAVQGDVRKLNEDSWVHDTELGLLMKGASITRVRRQRLRE